MSDSERHEGDRRDQSEAQRVLDSPEGKAAMQRIEARLTKGEREGTAELAELTLPTN